MTGIVHFKNVLSNGVTTGHSHNVKGKNGIHKTKVVPIKSPKIEVTLQSCKS